MAFSYSKALDGDSKDIALVRISRRNGIPLSTQIADATLETYSLRPRSALDVKPSSKNLWPRSTSSLKQPERRRSSMGFCAASSAHCHSLNPIRVLLPPACSDTLIAGFGQQRRHNSVRSQAP
ncbi:MAG: hypothetical protein HLUCCA05_14535 [Roseibaca calidilacus]|uniref:Uncharacterized protein n=1 Tax=Roseibaca calidilacus TaxID=1666912 RepID=A0A0N8K7B6_9RHOB|nr:MAG: hypothetical protein HLUCCA05_14535 [Roseibaca calidilacus]CUX80037.1 hypothetical protein Ga0058931_0742 [Roseibaca calidilacus]